MENTKNKMIFFSCVHNFDKVLKFYYYTGDKLCFISARNIGVQQTAGNFWNSLFKFTPLKKRFLNNNQKS